MADCELIATCLFFKDQMEKAPDMADYQKKKYCEGDNSVCARYIVFKALGRENVPRDLLPIQIDIGNELIAKLR